MQSGPQFAVLLTDDALDLGSAAAELLSDGFFGCSASEAVEDLVFHAIEQETWSACVSCGLDARFLLREAVCLHDLLGLVVLEKFGKRQ